MNYGNILRDLREEADLKQKDMAKIINITPSQYSHYENEKRTLPIKYLIFLGNYFNVSIDYLFGFTHIKKYDNEVLTVDLVLAGKRLREFRKENKLTQKFLANFLNTTFSTLSFYERGKFIIATPYLYSICKKYNISADYLLGKIDEPKYLKK